MDSDYDVYKDYPELRDIKPRRSGASGKRKRKMSSGFKLGLFLFVLILAGVLAFAAAPQLAENETVVYGKDGGVLRIKVSETEKYLSQGYYKTPSDITSVKMYSTDGSVITVLKGDMEELEKKGYTSDITVARQVLYSDDGKTLVVPIDMVETYKAKGWHDKLEDIVSTLYKEDGSKITVAKSETEQYIEQGWSDRLLKVAKKMVGPGGEEKMVFNKDVDTYLDRGWTVIKRAIDPQQPMVALTFDDGPGKYTDTLLDCLEKYNSAATFFCVGENVENFSDAVKRADKLGCEIGNHTWDHVNLTTISTDAAAATLKKTSDSVKALTGKSLKIYRPPYGSYSNETLKAADMPAVLWSIDTRDWKTLDADSTYNNVMENVFDGAIILMHDIHQPTVQAACRLIPELIDKGYQLVTVTEMMENKNGSIESGKAYFSANDIRE